MRALWMFLAIALVAGIAFVGCKKNPPPEDKPAQAQSQPQGQAPANQHQAIPVQGPGTGLPNPQEVGRQVQNDIDQAAARQKRTLDGAQ